MKRRLTLVAFHHMLCGCKPDKTRDYLMVCPMHLHAHHMRQELMWLAGLRLEPVIIQRIKKVVEMANGRS